MFGTLVLKKEGQSYDKLKLLGHKAQLTKLIVCKMLNGVPDLRFLKLEGFKRKNIASLKFGLFFKIC